MLHQMEQLVKKHKEESRGKTPAVKASHFLLLLLSLPPLPTSEDLNLKEDIVQLRSVDKGGCI